MPPISYSVSPTGTNASSAPYDPTGVPWEVSDYKQWGHLNYEVITYGESTQQWPPEACRTVSGLRINWGTFKNEQSQYTYYATSLPSVYRQQEYFFSSFESWSGSGLGSSGIIYSNQKAIHMRPQVAGDWAGMNYTNLHDVVIEITDPRILDGLDYGHSARALTQWIIDMVFIGGLQNGQNSMTNRVDNWRPDLII